MRHPHPAPKTAAVARPNIHMSMSSNARARMRVTEKAVYKYYNDMGKNKGNCTWGAGILAHRGVCSEEELIRTVNAQSVDIVFGQKVAEAEAIVRRDIFVPLNQAQFDALCSFTFNTGRTRAGDTFRLINHGEFTKAASNMSTLIKVSIVENGKKRHVVAPGLIKRRAEESAPFRIKSAAQSNAEN